MKDVGDQRALLELLNAQMTYPLFKSGKTVLSISELPFFHEYVLVKAKTFSTIPVVEFSFLWSQSGGDVIKIDGHRGSIFDNIELLKPEITLRTVVPYVKFVLGNVWDENGAIKVCERVEDIVFSATPSQSQMAALSDNLAPATTSVRGDMIVVSCNIVYGTALYQAEIEVMSSGIFEIIAEQQVGEEIEALRTIFLE